MLPGRCDGGLPGHSPGGPPPHPCCTILTFDFAVISWPIPHSSRELQRLESNPSAGSENRVQKLHCEKYHTELKVVNNICFKMILHNVREIRMFLNGYYLIMQILFLFAALVIGISYHPWRPPRQGLN